MTSDAGGGVQPLPLRGAAGYRSAYPVDRNNGIMWGGRGLAAGLSGGGRATLPRIEITVAPEIAWHENRDLRLAPTPGAQGAFQYPYHSLDWPQKHGDRPFFAVGPGQSAVAVSAGPLAVRAAAESLWWGPAYRYPILLSNTAGAVPHVTVVTDRPLWIGIGHLRGRMMWARLSESDFFDDQSTNNARLLTGLFLDLQPWFLDGLTLGAGLFYQLPWDDPASHMLDLFTFALTEEENSSGNGLASVTARWVHPESGFEAYMEWAREDFWLNTEDIFTEPDHALGYVMGFAKLFSGSTAATLLHGEWTNLQTHSEHRSLNRARPSFFVHELSHTHKGQLLGSSLGPGSDAQFLGASRIGAHRTLGVYIERVRRDEDAYYQRFVTDYGFRGHDVEWTVGLHGTEPLGSLRIDWETAVSRRKNRNFIGLDGRSWDFLRETNLTLELGAWWLPG